MNASPLAMMMLLIWPAVVFVLFSRFQRSTALIWSLVAGYLILPPVVAIDMPVIPALDKTTIPAIAAFAALALGGRPEDDGPAPRMGATLRLLIVALFVAPLLTALTNPEPLVEGISYRPGLTLSEGIAGGLVQLTHILPFVMAFRLLATAESARRLLAALVIATLFYSLPMLAEIRLSPQMNVWVYGFFQHDFQQTMRYGGFRPLVFLTHPLWLALFTLGALVSAVTLRRARATAGLSHGRWTAATLYLALLLVLTKSAGVLILAVFSIPMLLFLAPRRIALLSMIAGVLVCLYPVARGTLPLDSFVALVEATSPERAQSFEYRLTNEDALMARAAEKPLFGWGPWGRNLVVDPLNGRYTTITDGEWILVLGTRGIFGLTAEFGLLLAGLVAMRRAITRAAPADAIPLAGLATILALNMVDLLPNATLTPITWLVAGSLAGNAARLRAAPSPGAAASHAPASGAVPARRGPQAARPADTRQGLRPIL